MNLLHFTIVFLFGSFFTLIVLYSALKSDLAKILKNKPEKICKNCNFYIPCVSSMGVLKGTCRNCCVSTYHFNPDMSCGHFEYTEAIQNQINKKLLEKCYKK